MNQADELLADITKEFNKRLDDLEQFRIRIAPLLKFINDDGTVDAPAAAPDMAALRAHLWEVGENPQALKTASVTVDQLTVEQARLYIQAYTDGLNAAIDLLEKGGTDGTTGAGDKGGTDQG